MVEEAFRETTLAELLSRPRANTPRCRYPEAPEKAGR